MPNTDPEGPSTEPQRMGIRLLLIAIGASPFFLVVLFRRLFGREVRHMIDLAGIVIILGGMFLLWLMIPTIRRLKGLPPIKRSELLAARFSPEKLEEARMEKQRGRRAVFLIATFVLIYIALMAVCFCLQIYGVHINPASTLGTLSLLSISALFTWFGAKHCQSVPKREVD